METRTVAAVDVVLVDLCQMLKRAVTLPDLAAVRYFLRRIDEELEARQALTQRLKSMNTT